MADGLFDPSSLYARLAQANLLPAWAKTIPLSGVSGSYSPNTNKLVTPLPENKLTTSTLSHELTHASQYNFLYPALNVIAEKKRNNIPLTEEEVRYFDAGKKLLNTQPGTIGQYNRQEAATDKSSLEAIIKSLYKGTEEYKPYRTSADELQAFGVGNMTQGGMSGAEKVKVMGGSHSPHLDPSMATEFSILMDLFDKLPSGVRQGILEQRAKDIEANKKFYGNKDAAEKYYNFEKIDKDPFKSTIK